MHLDESPCDDVTAEGYFEHDDPTKYYYCSKGEEIVLDCDSGEEWDDEQKKCELVDDWSDFIYFYDYIMTLEENEGWPGKNEEITVIQETIDIVTVCLKGGQFYPHPDPTKFIHCAHGLPNIKDCPQGQIWINDKQWCDFGSVSSVSTVSTLPTKITTASEFIIFCFIHVI